MRHMRSTITLLGFERLGEKSQQSFLKHTGMPR